MAIKKGIYAASMSIFNQDLSLDIDSTIKHSERLIEQGLHGVVFFGSTGCSQLISSTEKKKLIDKLEKNKLKNHFLIGTGVNSLNENIELIKHSLKNGISRFLLMPPAYYKYDDQGVYSFYANLINKVPESEIILYNYEKLSGYKFSVDIIEKLVSDFPKQIVGVKDSTSNLFDKIKLPNFLVFPGTELKLLKGMEMGNSGIISAICNVTASLARRVYDDFQNKKKQTFNERLCAVRKVFDNYNLISALHTFMSIEDKKYNRVLPPLCLLTSKEEKEFLLKLKKLDFFPERKAA